MAFLLGREFDDQGNLKKKGQMVHILLPNFLPKLKKMQANQQILP